MTSSKKSSSKKISVRDFDPENEDFGTDVKKMASHSKKGTSLKYGHLDDLKVNAGNFDAGFGGKKYSGKAVSLEDYKKMKNSKSEEYSEEDSADSVEEDSEDSQGEEFEDEDSDEYDSSAEDNDSAEESNEDNDSELEVQMKSKSKASSLSAKMRELEMDGAEESFKLVSKTPVDSLEKSLHVRNQLVKFDEYVNVRFSLQPLLNNMNRFPSSQVLSQTKRKNAQVAAALDDTVLELDSLVNDLLNLSALELEQDGIVLPECDTTASDSKSSLQTMWNRMSQIDAAIEPFARETLQKWHNKMTLSSDLKAKKSLRMLNQDPYQQVQIALQDEDRLLARTRVRRDTSTKRFGSDLQEPSSTNIFDDNDFYQVLLKDWTASHGALSSTTASAMSAVLVQPKKKHRDGVDPRASKGRKIRYDVHPKLVNYMVPQIERGSWNDNKMDEFFASLLGQSVQSN